MKKTRNLIFILLVGLLTLVSATSCATLSGSDGSDGTEPSGPDIIEIDAIRDMVGYDTLTFTFSRNWPTSDYNTYWMISYDSSVLRLENSNTMSIPSSLRPTGDPRTHVMIRSNVTSSAGYYNSCAIEAKLTAIPQQEDVSSSITFYFVVQPKDYKSMYSIMAKTNDLTFTVHPNETVDLAAPSGRLYGFTYEGTISNEAYYIDTRAIVPGTRQKINTKYSSLNATNREYSASISIVGEYASYADAFFKEDSKGNRTYLYNYRSSASNYSLPFYLDVNNSITSSEAFAAGEDLQVEIIVADLEDGTFYKGVVSYPITVFDDSMCEISGITASSTGVGGQALSGTRVYIDATVEAFSTDDCFSNAKVIVTDRISGKVVLNTKSSMRNVGRSTVGTIANGWGTTDLFAENTFSFIPERTGEYIVEVLGYDSFGYNICYGSTSIRVI